MGSSAGDGDGSSKPNGFVEIAGVLVQEKILKESFQCDPLKYRCQAGCCSRGCLMHPHEIKKIRQYWDTIKKYIEPERRAYTHQEGDKTFFEECRPNCPCGFILGEHETRYVKAHVPKGAALRTFCTRNIGPMCFFAYHKDGEQWCALHSAALELKIPLQDIKPLDCIQFPLAVTHEQDKTHLVFQDTKEFCGLPCEGKESPAKMFVTLKDSIVLLLGEQFYAELARYAKLKEKQSIAA